MSTGYNKIVRKYKSVFGYYVREQNVTVAFICCMLSVLQLLAICCPPDPQQQTQARKQEMKWGVVKKGKMGGVFVKKSGKWGGCKKWTFPERRVHYVQYQYFLFYILLTWGCICIQPPLCLRAWNSSKFTAVGPCWDRQTDRRTDGRTEGQTDTVLLHRQTGSRNMVENQHT